MDNRETSPEDVVFGYTGIGCSVPKDVISVRFNEGVQKIEVVAFRHCTSLKSITLPSTVTEIGNSAFCGCSNLNEVIFNDGLQKIGYNAFQNCRSLKSIKLPSTVTEICYRAFYYCSNLTEVIFNDGLQKIGYNAFYNCSSLKSIILPPTVTEISYAFNSCNNLREVILNDGLQKVGNGAFQLCSSLESITLPCTVTEIGKNAFNLCSNLREVELNGVPRSVQSDTFSNCDALERILFPTISYRLENIKQTNHWETFDNKLNGVRGVVQWESDELFVLGAIPHNWDIVRRDLCRITQMVSYYELKEATSTFELALWKFNLDQAGATNTPNRADYRIDVPGPVKDTMLQYLVHT